MSNGLNERDPKPIWAEVKVKLKDGEPDYRIKWRGKYSFFWKDGPIALKKDTGRHEMIFKLDDDTGLNLRFFADPEDALWVQPDSCPKGKCNLGGQITPIAVEEDGQQLRVMNGNFGPKVDLHYALHFDGDKSVHGPPYCHDPIIKNAGGIKI